MWLETESGGQILNADLIHNLEVVRNVGDGTYEIQAVIITPGGLLGSKLITQIPSEKEAKLHLKGILMQLRREGKKDAKRKDLS